MRRIKLLIEYNGDGYVGWQIQRTGKSIQGEIERSLLEIYNNNIQLTVAGRTDAGVHALGQVAHFDLYDKKIPAEQICKALNFNLNKRKNKITILKSVVERDEFHARFSAKKKTYLYRIYNRESISYLHDKNSWFFPRELNLERMNNAAKLLLGRHDFNAFRSTHCQAKNSIRTIESIVIKKKRKLISIRIKGKSFLHNQIRIIVGSIVMVGENKWSTNSIKSILASRDRTKAGPTAPAHGLHLEKINY